MKMIKELYDIIEDDMRQHYVEAVDYFYNDYDPLYYHRLGNIVTHTGGLYDGFYIQNTDSNLKFYLDSDLLPKHHQDNSIVYDINVRQGVHGGIQFLKRDFLPITEPSIEDDMDNYVSHYLQLVLKSKLYSLVRKYIQKIIDAYRQEV